LGSLIPFGQVRTGSGELAECGSGSVINKGFDRSNNTIPENLLLVLAEAIIQSLQVIGIIFVFPGRNWVI
jgi:hypothetical protein